ncbi:hypothetical protein BDA96_01G182600 [Sorghum bicolor]|uniref:Secreted protein n=2 Tax=Sorghum bicolor TaxID=4558 RepID=A0A921RY06_SORBI|nr:hypothetical protein BDA96_01G182600 [Sorghum bicolor]KXG38066.1 hypothetical protein SORBI_3001G174400 [Sorghum bicolor]
MFLSLMYLFLTTFSVPGARTRGPTSQRASHDRRMAREAGEKIPIPFPCTSWLTVAVKIAYNAGPDASREPARGSSAGWRSR